ncbi:MAG TPA: NAD-dependent epimerase/dehydratase family protein [Terriglobia bacterium]|nr:NAD-dependent epimerase/dehydratase family protein [Terriglobia bacterium]
MNKHNASPLVGRRVLITGASGFIGSQLAEHLLSEGAIVGGLDRTGGGILGRSSNRNYFFLDCDLENLEDTRRNLREFAPQILFHLAAHPDAKEGPSQYHAVIKANILATVNALESFRACGGELFIYGDSSKVYGNTSIPVCESMPVQPLSSYAIAKVAGWEYCKLFTRLHDLAVVSVRPTLVYGPGQGFNLINRVVGAVLDGQQVLKLDGGNQTRAPLYIHDATRAFTAIAEKGREMSGRVISISGGSEITVVDLAQLIIRLMGSTMHVEVDLSRMRPTESMRSYCDNQEAFEAVGWEPRVSLRGGLKKTIDHLVEIRSRTEPFLNEGAAVSRQAGIQAEPLGN